MENNITLDKILDYVAPCSLLCYTCPVYKDGIIYHNAVSLSNYFVGYYDFMVENFPKEYMNAADDFSKFHKHLISYTQPMCDGCRNKPAPGCSIKGCVIPSCTKDHGVSFCGECDKFPCNNIDTSIYAQIVIELWLEGNTCIKKTGIKKFFEEKKNQSHYLKWNSGKTTSDKDYFF